jgi:hypothetical protein
MDIKNYMKMISSLIADEDVSTMNLADRTNLYFKVGNFILSGF